MTRLSGYCFGLLVSLACTQQNAYAQEKQTTAKPKKVYCNCAIKGLPRPKGLTLKYENRPSYGIKTVDKTGNFTNTDNKINRNGRWDLKIKFPIVNKPYLSIVGGLRYNREEYHFRDFTNNTNPLYKSLEDRTLKSIGANILIIKPFLGNKYLVLRANANLNGDYNKTTLSKTNYLKFSISPALGWKKTEDLTYAIGATYSYNFGRPLIFPTFAINYNLNDRWSLESVLPIFVKMRYTINENFFWYNNLEVDGASYRLNNTEAALASYNKLHLHRSELRLTTSLEKQVAGWIWAGAEIGYVRNVNYNLTNSANGRKDIIFKNTLNPGLLFNVSLFLVPPKSLFRRLAD